MMKLGLFVQGGGHHVAAWRHPSTPRNASVNFRHFVNLAQIAERGRFDMMFLADTIGTFGPDDPEVWRRGCAASRPEPVTILSALSAVTTHLGFVATFSTTFIEPFYVARQYASLDYISGGRAGWNLVTSAAPSEPPNFGAAKHVPAAVRYARAAEFAKVVLGLWNTWEDDAFVEDKESGIFFDKDKMHYLNHKGGFFDVRGPLTIRRSPQGRPVLVQAGQSEQGRELAAETAEVVFTVQQDMDAARAFRTDVHARARKYGREASSIKVMPGLVPFVAKTRAEAQAKFDELQALIHPELGLRVVSDMVGLDLRGYDPDSPMPDAPPNGMQEGRQRVVLDMAKKEGLTIRQTYERAVGARGHRIVIGTPQEIADNMEAWVKAGAADGFNIMPPMFPASLVDFVEMVIPELQRRGLFRKEYEGTTLRENLGLPFPVNPHAAERASKAAE